MIESARNELARRFSSSQEVTRLIQKAIHAAILDHKRAGNPIAVWENGQVVIIPPEEIELPDLEEDELEVEEWRD
ncbi:MAG: hypothetical protein M3Y56_02675 [Armatimonadota bacterium]|nr:hypothetical protein [Armatimonadota bacterium]